MKKNFLFVMAAAAMLASCSKDAAVSEPAGNGNENGVVDPTDPNSPVKIVLGASNVDASVEVDKKASRAPITSATWVGTEVGIYGLAKDAAFDEGWQTTDNSIVLDNVVGTIAEAEAVTLTGAPYYYPADNNVHYTFYGYYPYQAGAIEDQSTIVTKTFAINGTQDIMWGKASVDEPVTGTADDGPYDGYNAQFFRKTTGQKATINFGHMLTQLNFKIKQAAGFEKGQGLKINEIAIETYPSLDLTIADKTDATTGTIAPTPENPLEYITVKKNDTEVADAMEMDNIVNNEDGDLFGTSMMVYAAPGDQKSYKIRITLQLGEQAPVPSEVTFNLESGKDFVAGTSYNVNISVNSMMEVKVNATLTEWVTADEDADIEIN